MIRPLLFTVQGDPIGLCEGEKNMLDDEILYPAQRYSLQDLIAKLSFFRPKNSRCVELLNLTFVVSNDR